MREGKVQEALDRLFEAIPEKVIAFSPKDGDRVKVEFQGVEAFGVIGPRAYHWHTMEGLDNFPVILDGTGEKVVVSSSLLSYA